MEYIKCINTTGWEQTVKENGGNLIFREDFKSSCSNQCYDAYKNNNLDFQLSTKEAYDAQFVVKDEFVLPYAWYVVVDKENLDILSNWISPNDFKLTIGGIAGICNFGGKIGEKGHNLTKIIKGFSYDFGQEITFEQFKKYVLKEETVVEEVKVIEPLSQFKVIETIETITKVENNEGNQFFVGDIVISSNGTIQTIESFGYNKAKTNIIAFTNKQSRLGNGIGIDKIEHYIEPKVEVEETLLEKAKRLYPVGTKFIPTKRSSGNTDISTGEFVENNGNIFHKKDKVSVFYEGIWAKIIK